MLACNRNIYVFKSAGCAPEVLADGGNITVFDWEGEANKLENIFSLDRIKHAKQIVLRYASSHENVEESPQNGDAIWQTCSSFVRYSNIGAADYHAVRKVMIGDKAIEGEFLELLSELEHIRWCRYHYSNNWTYGIPDDKTKAKDPEKRIHSCLRPYSELSEQEKEKDRENIRVLTELDLQV